MDGITDEHNLSYVFTLNKKYFKFPAQGSTSLFLACKAHLGDFSALAEQYCTQSDTVATVTRLNDCVQNKN